MDMTDKVIMYQLFFFIVSFGYRLRSIVFRVVRLGCDMSHEANVIQSVGIM